MFARFGPRYRFYLSFTAMLGTMAMVLTATMINVAIPVIMGTFGVGQDVVHWLSTGFIAAMTISMLINDWSVRAFGERATYLAAMAIFTFGAVLGGLCNSIDTMIAARILQGLGAGMVQPLSMILMFQVFPVEQRGRAMGLFGVGIIVAPALGPTLGGVLLDLFNWRYVFFMSVPVAAAGVLLALVFMPSRKREGPLPVFDWTGLVLVIIFVSAILTGMSSGQREGWGAPIIAVYFSAAAVSGLAFIVWELTTAEPIMQLRVFNNSSFTAAAIVGMVLGAGLFGSIYVVPLFVQTVQGYTPTRSGLLMVPGGILMMISFPIAGYLSDKLPSYQLVMFGLFTFGASSLLMIQVHTDTPFWTFAIWIMIGRVGLAAIMPTLTVTAVATLRPEQLSQGAGAINFTRQLGGAVGVNLMAMLLEQRTAFFSDAFAGLQTPDNFTAMHLMTQFAHKLSQLGWPLEMTPAGALYLVGRSVYAQASMMAFRDVFLFIALVYFATMIPAILLRKRKPKAMAQPQTLPRARPRPS
ncbi:MAG: DHA2 family efflux MFS transporter permease subunit [Alphaproteobacteria bacterium]|nr:DHA2 family efflux MFS transporter permease subunit [Alphaproteobacteria bacterium]